MRRGTWIESKIAIRTSPSRADSQIRIGRWGSGQSSWQKKTEQLSEAVKLLARMTLRYKNELSQIRIEKKFILTLEVHGGGILPTMYQVAQTWKKSRKGHRLSSFRLILLERLWQKPCSWVSVRKNLGLLHFHWDTEIPSWTELNGFLVLISGLGSTKVAAFRIRPAKMERQLLARRFPPPNRGYPRRQPLNHQQLEVEEQGSRHIIGSIGMPGGNLEILTTFAS